MDANGLKQWLLADAAQWRIAGNPPALGYDPVRRRLRLAGRRTIAVVGDAEAAVVEAQALSHLESIPEAMDRFGMCASWDAAAQAVVAVGAGAGRLPIVPIPTGQVPSDIAMGYDDVLYVALGHRILLHDTRARWAPQSVESADGAAWRLAADPSGGVWVLDRIRRRIGRVKGLPFPDRPSAPYAPDTVRPCAENPHPPHLLDAASDVFAPDEQPVALACRADGVVAVLTWVSGGEARVRLMDPTGWLGAAITLQGAGRPYSVAWVGLDRLAVLVIGLPDEALVYSLRAEATTDMSGFVAEPVGDLYPLTDHSGGPFLHGLSDPPHYPTVDGAAGVYPISLPSFATLGEAGNASLMDSGSSQTLWHRLYVEAEIPADCAVVVTVAASDEAMPPTSEEDWHPHCFGGTTGRQGRVPQGAWVSSASEVPFYPGLLNCPLVRDRAGLFTVLIQRANRAVSQLKGRYLWVRLALSGNGRATPEVAAVRAYASRFSYRDRYLPELYRETRFGDDAEAVLQVGVPATPSDFLERFLDNMEGVLTPIEDRIASAYLLTDPRTTPNEALEWLGSWIGVTFDPAYPPDRRRQHIALAPELYRKRGTLDGLTMALDVATGGAVTSGEIVVLEDYRLRRTMGTILGGDFADEEDPLLGGLVVSGNSLVGDSLFLGQEERREFLALFSDELNVSAREERAVEAFLDRVAFRVTVMVHQEVEPQDLGLIKRVVSLESPAHVAVRVVTASEPFLVGAASLVGVDTYLGPAQPIRPVRVGRSRLGRRDVLVHSSSLDPRMETLAAVVPTPRAQAPVADAGIDRTVGFGRSFELDARGSQAAEGRRLARYVWEWLA
ncbi:MAG: phage tail protein [Nitrospirota bacterium]|nr:phage tail protein [Nitrospirota bacterium]MDP2383233.1 phage tail protein [Nitrospirota bacterium]MDP3597546.1 phage tail protein [Nitrospirota bacterium]